ncbi:VOC family protein [Embleya hyalina]|uniref:4-hydroxyphenylpyruvate dioxygenase n=1 Tax=Embleya hyalina TaxID=516124 RepID=A0A401YQP6_9ACTN|nr:VOC family protein [Embleya hyalina]GCD96920.1 4-hydroxyphenylpyruvate dioxygenase [Embleya hyalina]
MAVDHVRIWTDDPTGRAREMVHRYGFAVAGGCNDGENPGTLSVAVRQGDVVLLFTRPGPDQVEAIAGLERHGECVGDIALRVSDVDHAFRRTLDAGGVALLRPQPTADGWGGRIAAIAGFGDVRHTLIQVPEKYDEGAYVPGIGPISAFVGARPRHGVRAIDHFAVCLPSGQLACTVDYYRRVLGCVATSAARVAVGGRATRSQAVRSRSQALTITFVEPEPSHAPGRIDGFPRDHDGPGVRHIALACDDIVAAVSGLVDDGVRFPTTPAARREPARTRPFPMRHSREALAELGVLVDHDHDGPLLRIVAESTHPRGTFSWEIIERPGTRTFGRDDGTALRESARPTRGTGPPAWRERPPNRRRA